MPLSILKFSSVNVKARALYGQLLTRADYEELVGKRTVQDVAAYLKKRTGYDHLLSSINENSVHRGDLEKLFSTSLYGDFIKFLKFLNGKPADFLKEAFLRYEIEDLKVLLRVITTGRNKEAAIDSLMFLRNYSSLDCEKLIRSRDINDFIDNLRGSQYYKVLYPFLEKKESRNLFDMEMTLDLHFFMTILKKIKSLLSGSDRRTIEKSFGIEIDLLNILWIYRCKKLFNLSKEVTLNHVIPHWFHLRREQLIQLAESHDIEEFNSVLSRTRYKSVFQPGMEHRWETSHMNYLYKVYKTQFRNDFFNIGAMMAYIHLKDIDLKNIITLIEGIRYGLPKEEINALLIGGSR